MSHTSRRGGLQLPHLGYSPFGSHHDMEKNSNGTTVTFRAPAMCQARLVCDQEQSPNDSELAGVFILEFN